MPAFELHADGWHEAVVEQGRRVSSRRLAAPPVLGPGDLVFDATYRFGRITWLDATRRTHELPQAKWPESAREFARRHASLEAVYLAAFDADAFDERARQAGELLAEEQRPLVAHVPARKVVVAVRRDAASPAWWATVGEWPSSGWAWIPSSRREARFERPVLALDWRGGTTDYDLSAQLTALRHLRIGSCSRAGARELRRLRPLRWLRSLHMSQSSSSNAALEALRDLPELRELEASQDVDGAGLARLAGLPLTHLRLFGCGRVRDAGLRELAGVPTLTHLDLSQTETSTTGLSHLAALPALEALNLAWCERVDASGAAILRSLPALRRVDASGTGIPAGRLGNIEVVRRW